MSQVWDIEGIDSSECLVLIALADHADDQGRCYPSIGRLAKRTKLSDRGVQKVISRLIEKGFVSVSPCAGQGGSNLYTVTATPEPSSPLNDVHPRTAFTTPPNHVRKTPEPRSPKPSRTVIEPSFSKTEAKPVEILAEVASENAASSFVAFRKQIKKPLTATAAGRLRGSLSQIKAQGGDPDDALGMAEERGWQSIKPEWYFKEAANGQPAQHNHQLSRADATSLGFDVVARTRRASSENLF